MRIAHAYGYRDASPVHRYVRRAVGTRPMSWFLARALHPLDRWSYRLSGGRAMVSSVLTGLPVMLLTSRGARSGVERTLPVLAIADGDAIVVIGSNYGQPHDPGWVFNLRAHPAVRTRFEDRDRHMVARELTGAERDDAYQRAIDIYPGYIGYRRRAAPRAIPVFRLDPA
jgi:deazaflavin-dependent oxidoreductase (nitroreductase family)